MSAKTTFRIAITIVTIAVLAVLLLWQDARLKLVNDCRSRGGHWDGGSERCRMVPTPRIYIERGLKRT